MQHQNLNSSTFQKFRVLRSNAVFAENNTVALRNVSLSNPSLRFLWKQRGITLYVLECSKSRDLLRPKIADCWTSYRSLKHYESILKERQLPAQIGTEHPQSCRTPFCSRMLRNIHQLRRQPDGAQSLTHSLTNALYKQCIKPKTHQECSFLHKETA